MSELVQGRAGERGSEAAEPAVRVRSLKVSRSKREVLHGLDFDVERGEIVGLLGPSGCGKSTLMRTLVGVQLGASGECSVLGMPAGSKELRSRVGYVTQEASVYGDLTVSENLRYFAAMVGADAERVDVVLGDVDLQNERDRLVGSLSGGQHNRVSLAAALLISIRSRGRASAQQVASTSTTMNSTGAEARCRRAHNEVPSG